MMVETAFLRVCGGCALLRNNWRAGMLSDRIICWSVAGLLKGDQLYLTAN
jgi:hypothetical protein